MKFFTRKTWSHFGGSAGLIGVMGGKYKCPGGEVVERWALHIFVSRDTWQWGYREDWCDGPIPSFGLGPLFLLIW